VARKTCATYLHVQLEGANLVELGNSDPVGKWLVENDV